MAKRQEITSTEMDAIKKVVSSSFMSDFDSVDKPYIERDERSDIQKQFNLGMVKRVSETFQMYEQFQKDMDAEVSKVVNDPYLASEQKRAVIKHIAEEKSAHYNAQIDEKMKAYRQKVAEVKNHLGEMISATEKMTPQQMREFDFISRDMESETRTSLATAFSLSQVMAVFNKQTDLARHNKAKARFMVKNAHLHMAKVAEMATDENEKSRYVRDIQTQINRLERIAFDPHQTGLKKMYSNASLFKRSGLDGKRMIALHMQKYI